MHAIGGDAEGLHRAGHAGGIGVVEAGDLGVGVVVDHPEQVAHVHVVEADASDAELGHVSLP